MATQEPEAAAALVNANKTLSQAPAAGAVVAATAEHGALKAPEHRDHHRVQSSSAVGSRTASPARFDSTQIGRRLLTPPITRSNSAQGSSVPGTPRRESTEAIEGDVDRASTLM